MSCGIDIEVNDLFAKLLAGEDFKIPDINLDDPMFQLPGGLDNPLYQAIVRLKNLDITEKKVDGSGTYDVMMAGFKAHLREEYENNRIAGAEYAKAYVSLNESAMAGAIQFTLGREQSFFASLAAQVQAVTAVVQLNTARVELARMQMSAANEKANYALTKSKLGRESVDYCLSKYQLEELSPLQKELLVAQVASQVTDEQIASYNLTNMLPKQLETLVKQLVGIDTQNQTAQYNLTSILPAQLSTMQEQLEGIGIQNQTGQYNLSTMLPAQLLNLQKQGFVLDEQAEVQRAQTLDTRKDGANVVGVMGKQKDLYAQQITSYQRDAEVKAARMWADIWTVNKTVDDGVVIPDIFNNLNTQEVFEKIKLNNGLT